MEKLTALFLIFSGSVFAQNGNNNSPGNLMYIFNNIPGIKVSNNGDFEGNTQIWNVNTNSSSKNKKSGIPTGKIFTSLARSEVINGVNNPSSPPMYKVDINNKENGDKTLFANFHPKDEMTHEMWMANFNQNQIDAVTNCNLAPTSRTCVTATANVCRQYSNKFVAKSYEDKIKECSSFIESVRKLFTREEMNVSAQHLKMGGLDKDQNIKTVASGDSTIGSDLNLAAKTLTTLNDMCGKYFQSSGTKALVNGDGSPSKVLYPGGGGHHE